MASRGKKARKQAKPEWPSTRDYSYLRGLDAAGWLDLLQRCKAQLQPVDLTEWESIGEPGWTKDYIPAHIGPPAVQSISKADQSTLADIEKSALIVQVWLGAPDRAIIEAFKRELRLARDVTPAPVKTRGSTKAPAAIGAMHFNGWIAHRIVQLLLWRSGLTSKEKPTDADIGRRLFPSSRYPRKEVAIAKKTLYSALTLIPALSAQIAGVTSNFEK